MFQRASACMFAGYSLTTDENLVKFYGMIEYNPGTNL